MNRKLAGSLAAVAALSMGLAACGSSHSGSSGSKQGKPLVIETTALSPMTDTFNPFVAGSTGYTMHAVDLYQQPLFVYNLLNPTQKPIPELGLSYSWSNNGETLTITTRSGVKWSDGKPFSAADVAFTFKLLKQFPALNVQGTPVPTTASGSGNTATLTFSQPEYASLYLILGLQIVPQHIWASLSNPATFSDPTPVGTGPYVLDKFSPQGFTMKVNPDYYAKSSLHVPEADFPSYTSNANLVPPVASGQIDWAGNNITGLQQNYLGKSTDNHTFSTSAPYLSDNNVVGLWFNTTKPGLNNALVRQAISLSINRQQLSVDGESGNEPAETTSSGLLLPTDNSYLTSSLTNDLPATGDAAKASALMGQAGYKKVGGFWEKSGQKVTFSIMDPVIYSDYYLDSTLLATQLKKAGFDVTVQGEPGPNGPTVWTKNLTDGNFTAAIRWGANGVTPYYYYDNWMDDTLTAPIGQTATADYGRFKDPAAQAALEAYAKTSTTTAQNEAIARLENIFSTQVPVAPLLAGAAWAEFSTRDYTGWPTSSNPYMDPGPNIPEVLYTVTQLKPTS
jgi:peptide/nickel transport system substrate-binding protein